jgi:paraquat-inducible protein B
MSKKASPTLVGAFVLGALVLGVVGLVTLGSLDVFSPRLRAVLYFDGAVRGLNVGSAVSYRGVQVGRVVGIDLHIDPSTGDSLVPVAVELDPSIVRPLREKFDSPKPGDGLRQLVDQGLKGRLETQSILTGLLLIELEHLPDEPARLVGNEDEDVIEIPTVPTLLQRLDRTLASLDLERMTRDIQSIVSGVEAFVSSPRLTEMLDALPPTLAHYDALAQRLGASASDISQFLRDADALVEHIGQRTDPTLDRVDAVLDEMHAGVVDVREAIDGIEARLQSESGMLAGIEEAVDATGIALRSARDVLDEGSTIAPELRAALREFGDAARSLSQLAELLERRPEVLLRGK